MGPKKGQLYNSAAVEAEKAKGAGFSREIATPTLQTGWKLLEWETFRLFRHPKK